MAAGCWTSSYQKTAEAIGYHDTESPPISVAALTGVALAYSELPNQLCRAMPERIYERGGELEVEFHFGVRDRILPVWHAGQLVLIPWGTRRDENEYLPVTGWTRQATVESGYWSELRTASVVIPATMGLDQGIWYRIRQGIRAILVRDEAGDPRVYPICEPATHYYQIITKSDWMPVQVSQERSVLLTSD